jgi:hypothetical protein
VNLLDQNSFDFIKCCLIQSKIEGAADGVKLAGTACTPQHRADSGLVKGPSDDQLDDPLAVSLARERVQSLDGTQILSEARLSKLWIDAP